MSLYCRHFVKYINRVAVLVEDLFLHVEFGRSFNSVLENAFVEDRGGIDVHFVRVDFDLIQFRTVSRVSLCDEHVLLLRVRALELQG